MNLIGKLGGELPEHLLYAHGQLGAVDDETELGVQVRRTRIEVQGADEYLAAVDGKGFRMQAGAGAAEYAQAAVLVSRVARSAPQFEKRDASLKQIGSSFFVAGVHRQDIGGLQRVRHYLYLHPAAGQTGEEFSSSF